MHRLFRTVHTVFLHMHMHMHTHVVSRSYSLATQCHVAICIIGS
jgi:hypothetical protein